MVLVLGNGQRAGSPSQKIQVVHVVPWSGNHRMVPAVYQNRIAISRPYGASINVFVGIEVLKSKPFRPGGAIVINFVLVHFFGWIVSVMLVRRVARPVSTRRINLDDD